MKQENKSILFIRHSLTFDVERILSTIKKLEWYKNQKYHVDIPVSIRKNPKKTRKEIIKIIREKYQRARINYERIITKVRLWWQKHGDIFLERMKQHEIKIFPRYIIWLTKYGSGGSYNPPNSIVINISKKSLRKIYTIILHEIIHLGIEDLIARYHIPHFAKERMVDYLAPEISPEFSKKQNLPLNNDVQKMDLAWQKGENKLAKEIIKNFVEINKKSSD